MEKSTENVNEMNELKEEYLEDMEYIQADTLKNLEKKVRQKIEKDFAVIENNPFWDAQTNQWTQVILYYNDEEESE